MTTFEAAQPRAEVGRSFYLWMSLAMAATIIAGFSQTVPADFAAPGIPLLLHVHGAIFTLWVALAVAQPVLIGRRELRLHRRLGYAGTGLAVAMSAMAVGATLLAVSKNIVPAGFPPAIFLAMNMIDVVLFAGLVTAAVLLRGNREWHKRLMICATASILSPGLGRALPMAALGPMAPLVMFGLNDLFFLVGPVADLIVRKRVHPAYLWGLGGMIGAELLIGPVAFAPFTQAALHALQGH